VRGTGTSIYFRPDPEIFESTEFDAAWIRENLEIKTYLNRRLRIVFTDKVNGKRDEFQHDGGIAEYLQHLVVHNKLRPVHEDVFAVNQETLREGARVEVSLQWTESPKELIRSFVNGIPTRDGGMHEQGST
jgi:DNA gyrase/topoisomerase IV subunit B